MAISAKQLPIVRPCAESVRLETRAGTSLWCDHCSRVVHDLSALRENEIHSLLRRNAGKRICISYRIKSDGNVATRPDPTPRWIAGLAATLMGCASHLVGDELDAPGACDGSWTCHDPVLAAWTAPDDVLESEGAEEKRSPPPAEDPNEAAPDASGLEDAARDGPTGIPPHPAESRSDGAPSTSSVQVNFAIDPANEMRGMVVLGTFESKWHHEDGRPRFVPTRELIADLRARLAKRAQDRAKRRSL
jgi:hypothetical protein